MLFTHFSGGLEDLLFELNNAISLIAVDTETSGLHKDDGSVVSSLSLAWLSQYMGKPTSHVLNFDQGGVKDGSNWWKPVLKALRYAPSGLVMHNAKFDLMQLSGYNKLGCPGTDLADNIKLDTMVAAREVWPTYSAALKPTAVRLFGEDSDAEQKALAPYLGTKINPRYDLVPAEIMNPYARKDAELTLQLALRVEEETFGDPETKASIVREMKLMRILYEMESNGVPFDHKQSLKIAVELEHEIKRIEETLPFARKDAKKYYFLDDGLKLEPYALTPTGAPKLTADILDLMARDEVEHAKDLVEANRIATAIKMWYTPYAERTASDGRIRTVFRQVASGYGATGGTVSGRYSAERLNLQAIPHDYRLKGYLRNVPSPRKLISSATEEFPDYEIWELDLAQAELRVAALFAGCDSMLQAVKNGDDLHSITTKNIFGIDEDDKDFKVLRNVGKRANFSCIFGVGGQTFADMVSKETGNPMSVREAKKIVYAWNDLFPEYQRALDAFDKHAKSNGNVELANGRKRYFAPREDTYKAFNQIVQGSLAELGKDWLIRTSCYLNKIGVSAEFVKKHPGRGGAGLLLVIHDSQMLLLPKDNADEIAKQVRLEGLKVWDEMFPKVPGDIDYKSWSS